MNHTQIAIDKNPALVKLMNSYLPKEKGLHPTDLLPSYKRFINDKNKIDCHLFYARFINDYYIETVNSPSFGTKDFFKTDYQLMFWDIYVMIYQNRK